MEKISIYSCRAISAVVKTRNFTKAAQLLNLTPSAVSHLIKKTENDLGYSLFIRSNKGASLTENGKLLLPYIQPLILQYIGYDTEIATYFSNNNLPLGSNYRVETDDAALALVEEGLGFFISPEMAVKKNKRQINIYPLSPQMNRTVGIVTVSPEHITPTAKLFRQYVYNYMDENGLLNV